jgi:hypothetical protein
VLDVVVAFFALDVVVFLVLDDVVFLLLDVVVFFVEVEVDVDFLDELVVVFGVVIVAECLELSTDTIEEATDTVSTLRVVVEECVMVVSLGLTEKTLPKSRLEGAEPAAAFDVEWDEAEAALDVEAG